MRIKGLTRIVSGSRASDTPCPRQLCPKRRPLCPYEPIVGVFRRGGLRFGRHAAPNRDLSATKRKELRCERRTVELIPRRGRRQTGGIAALGARGRACPASRAPANGGNCTIRGATRRRHGDRMLLMMQNPHRQPERHPGAEGGGSESTGAL